MSDCLLNIVGVTDKTDIPYYADQEADLKTAIAASSSGLFLDRLTGGVDLYGIDDDTYMPRILKLGVDACNEAAKLLYSDLLVAINNRFHPAKTNYNGFIGRRTVSRTFNSTGNLQGHRYRTIEPIAGTLKISSIAVNVNGNADFKIYVARCESKERAFPEGAVLHEFPVTSVAGVFTNCNMTSVSNKLELPLEIDGVPQEYYIYWKRDESGGLLPKDNDIKCGTCSGKKQLQALDGFFISNGVSFNDTSKLTNVSADKYGHGISVAAVVSCDHERVVCREYEKKEAVKLMIQKAAQYKAGSLWIEYIMKTGYVNRDNMQNREYFWGKRNNFEKEYNERITAIANKMELGETNCYTCNDAPMSKGTILS